MVAEVIIYHDKVMCSVQKTAVKDIRSKSILATLCKRTHKSNTLIQSSEPNTQEKIKIVSLLKFQSFEEHIMS